jgi:hypothetical protein
MAIPLEYFYFLLGRHFVWELTLSLISGCRGEAFQGLILAQLAIGFQPSIEDLWAVLLKLFPMTRNGSVRSYVISAFWAVFLTFFPMTGDASMKSSVMSALAAPRGPAELGWLADIKEVMVLGT